MGSRIFGRRFFALVLLAAAPLGCVDPGKRFDDFDRRVIDADLGGVQCEGALRNISGEFFTSISISFAPEDVLEFVSTVDMTSEGGAGTASFSIQPLVTADPQCEAPEEDIRTPVGDPLVAEDVAVDGAGAFEIEFEGATVPGLANPISCGDILADITLTGIIRSPDQWCGAASGMVMLPIQATLEGSTFGAVRVDPGTEGADLPDPQPACPACGDPDAG
jgi:hypothetical protein